MSNKTTCILLAVCYYKRVIVNKNIMRIIIKQGDWTTKTLKIKNKTIRTLKNGRVIPTASNMFRQIAKQ